MVGIEINEKLNDIINNLKNYIIDSELISSDFNKLQKVIYKLENIKIILENIDYDLIKDFFEDDVTKISNDSNQIVIGNNNFIPNIINHCNETFEKIIKYLDFNMVLNNKSNIKNYVKNYKTEITKQSKSLENEVNNILSFIEEQKINIINSKDQLAVKINDLDKKFNNLDDNQEVISNEINAFLEDNKKIVEDFVKNKKEELENNINEMTSTYEKRFDDLEKSINEKDEAISKLIDIVGDKTRVGQYKKNADDAHNERILWQIITVILFLVSFVVMSVVAFRSNNYDKYTIIKYIISAVLMGGATYTAKQASNSRKDEIYFRKQELELASIDVYLSNMDQERREEIKQNLSSKMFGQASNTYSYKYDDKITLSSKDIINFIDSIKK